MGSRMARRLHDLGHPLVVCEADPERRASFEAIGVKTAEHGAMCGTADVIIVMVAEYTQASQVLTGHQGLKDGLDGTHIPIVLIMSTILPAQCHALQDALGRNFARLVDAPVSGGLLGAEEGSLTIMTAGMKNDIDEAFPVLEGLGRSIYRCGALGSGQLAKIINNYIGIMNIFCSPEAFELAARYGMTLETLAPILEHGTGRNYFTENIDRSCKNFSAWSETSEGFTSLVGIVRKDLQLAETLATQAGMDLPMLHAIQGALRKTGEEARQQWISVAAARRPKMYRGAEHCLAVEKRAPRFARTSG